MAEKKTKRKAHSKTNRYQKAMTIRADPTMVDQFKEFADDADISQGELFEQVFRDFLDHMLVEEGYIDRIRKQAFARREEEMSEEEGNE